MCSAFVQNLTNEEQVVIIQARTVLTLAEKVTAPQQPWLCWRASHPLETASYPLGTASHPLGREHPTLWGEPHGSTAGELPAPHQKPWSPGWDWSFMGLGLCVGLELCSGCAKLGSGWAQAVLNHAQAVLSQALLSLSGSSRSR